jgi:tetratricopeptide (TPR) repeat protein
VHAQSIPTFSRDIAPILREQCVACHRPEGGAPFSLLTFADARARASLIVRATKARYMPPWKPQPGHGDFADARRLTEEQIAVIERWAENGAREGDPLGRPILTTSGETWEFGPPDIVVAMPEAYTLPPEGTDVIRSFIIPVAGARGRFVRALEFHAGNTRVVHHANIKVDATGSSRRLDAEDAGAGFEGSSRDAKFPDGYFLGWTPGQRAHASPGNAWYLPAGADLVVELHLTPTGKAERVQSSIGLFLSDVAPSRTPYMIRLGSQRIDIPAGAVAYGTSDRYVLPVDVDLLAVQPHAHNLARSIKGYAQLPDGRREWLIDISDWDFRWQDVYRYAAPVHLPRGTVLEMQYTYDNSDGNPRNPNRPPRRVTFGQTSSSEMGDLWFQVSTASDKDRATLDADYAPKMLREDIAGDETTLLTHPNDARLRRDLALCYLEAGRIDDAIAEFERSLALEPNAVDQHYELGVILLRVNKFEAAATHFRRAVALKPDDAESYNGLGAVAFATGANDDAIRLFQQSVRARDNALAHYNLGRTFARAGRLDEAVAQYEAALAMKSDDPDAHVGLGAVLVERGEGSAAVAHYREALRIRPDLVSAMTNLAWILATSTDTSLRQTSEAVRLAEEAVRLTDSKNAVILDTLAVSYFEAGRSGDAVRTARAAVDRAVADHDEATADRLRTRLRSYEDQIPR